MKTIHSPKVKRLAVRRYNSHRTKSTPRWKDAANSVKLAYLHLTAFEVNRKEILDQ